MVTVNVNRQDEPRRPNSIVLAGLVVLLLVAACDVVGASFVGNGVTTTTNSIPRLQRGCGRSSVVLSSSVSEQHDGWTAAREALVKMESLRRPSFGEDATASLRRFHKDLVRAVEVRPSAIPGAGMGLFARQKLKAGTIVGLYPAHRLGVEFTDGGSEYRTVHEEDRAYFDDDAHDDNNYLHFLLGSRPLLGRDVVTTDTLFGAATDALFCDVDPRRAVVTPWTAHCVNDGAVVESYDEDGALRYYARSNASKNCVIIPFGPAPLLAACTTKKIRPGDELFTSYGCSYWLEALGNEGQDDGDSDDDLITEAVQAKVKDTALDVFTAMQRANLRYAAEAQDLAALFAS